MFVHLSIPSQLSTFRENFRTRSSKASATAATTTSTMPRAEATTTTTVTTILAVTISTMSIRPRTTIPKRAIAKILQQEQQQ